MAGRFEAHHRATWEESQGIADLIGRFSHDDKAAKAVVPF